MLVYTPIVLLSLLLHVADARRNVSLDDSDPAIVYYGNWLHTPYDPTNKGGHHMVTADNDAYATLAFTGIAIYFYSPLWPFRVTTAVSLDGQSTELDLRDYSVPFHQDGAETASSEVVWSINGLDNNSHLLNVSVAVGEDLAILDYIIYTVVETNDPPITPTSVSNTYARSVTLSSSSSSTSPTHATSSSSTKIGLSVTLGLVCVIFSSVVIWAMFWWWKRRHRRRLDDQSIASSHDHSSMAEARPTFPRTTGIPYPNTVANLSFGIKPKQSRRAGPSSRRSNGPSRLTMQTSRGVNKTLTTIPETSDPLNEEEEDSSTSSSTSTGATSSSVKNDSPGDIRNDSQDDKPTVRLVTDNSNS